jgi:hypothetical protein
VYSLLLYLIFISHSLKSMFVLMYILVNMSHSAKFWCCYHLLIRNGVGFVFILMFISTDDDDDNESYGCKWRNKSLLYVCQSILYIKCLFY